jgi:hypothetical protein
MLPTLAADFHYQRPPGTLLASLALLNATSLLLPAQRQGWKHRCQVPALSVACASALVLWRTVALSRFSPNAGERSRACFYWCLSGSKGGTTVPDPDPFQAARFGGADTIAQHAWLPLALLLGGSLIVWRWDRTWSAATAATSLPLLIMTVRHHYWLLFDVHIGILPTGPHEGFYTRQPSPVLLIAAPAAWILATAGAVTLANRSTDKGLRTWKRRRVSIDGELNAANGTSGRPQPHSRGFLRLPKITQRHTGTEMPPRPEGRDGRRSLRPAYFAFLADRR